MRKGPWTSAILATLTISVLAIVALYSMNTSSNDREAIPTSHELIRVATPKAGQIVTSPIIIRGQARGQWFFEANFPIVLVDSERTTIGETFATAEGEWMTADFVPFTAKLYFEQAPGPNNNMGTLILKKSNASSLIEHDDSFELRVRLEGGGNSNPNPNIEQDINLWHEDSDIGFRFEYKVSPRGYVIEEAPKIEGDDPDLLKMIILTRIADYEDLRDSNDAREGPPSIAIQVYKLHRYTSRDFETWLESRKNYTNFNPDTVETYVIAGEKGLKYSWDGLYSGETAVVKNTDVAYIISGTYLSGVEDGRYTDFVNLVNSFNFID